MDAKDEIGFLNELFAATISTRSGMGSWPNNSNQLKKTCLYGTTVS